MGRAFRTWNTLATLPAKNLYLAPSLVLFTLFFGPLVTSFAVAGRLEEVRTRGKLVCGVMPNFYGFSFPNSRGEMEGFDADICRAVAAAIFQDPTKVAFVPTPFPVRFGMLQSGQVDMLAGNASWTIGREVELGLTFPVRSFYEGQTFMVRRDTGITKLRDAEGATFCLSQGTTTERLLSDWGQRERVSYKPLVFQESDVLLDSFFANRCDVMVGSVPALQGARSRRANPDDYVILENETMGYEIQSPVVLSSDNQWAMIVRWTVHALIKAEEMGITAVNVDQMRRTNSNPAVRRFLNGVGEVHKRLGLPQDWTFHVIRSTGNYGEIFDRHLGANSVLKLRRDRNAQWFAGGMHLAPNFD